jgi:hypothetical protein
MPVTTLPVVLAGLNPTAVLIISAMRETCSAR